MVPSPPPLRPPGGEDGKVGPTGSHEIPGKIPYIFIFDHYFLAPRNPPPQASKKKRPYRPTSPLLGDFSRQHRHVEFLSEPGFNPRGWVAMEAGVSPYRRCLLVPHACLCASAGSIPRLTFRILQS